MREGGEGGEGGGGLEEGGGREEVPVTSEGDFVLRTGREQETKGGGV